LKSILLTLLAIPLFTLSHKAQNDCDYQPSSKVEKLIAQSKDSKKYEYAQRVEFVEKALDEDPKCLPCMLSYGEMLFKKAKREGTTFSAAKSQFEKLKETCEDYHSEIYYFLGAIEYADHNYDNTILYFEKFLRFPDGDPNKFEKDYDKKYKEVEEALASAKVYKDIYGEKIDFNPIRVAGVSSTDGEYLPMISPDGEIMFYTRATQKQAKGDLSMKTIETFTWSRRPDINARFDAGKSLPPPFNQAQNTGASTISLDNRELIVAMKVPVKGHPENFDLFSTRYDMYVNDKGENDYKWSPLVNLGTNVNTDSTWESQPSLSGDGKLLFFTTVRPGCIKDKDGNYTQDIFYSEKQSDGTWGPGKPVSSGINTKGSDKAPYMHSDSHTLYFTSDGRQGVGGADIYYCKMNTDGSFTEPKNIGYPINSDQDEIGIVVTSDGEVAYFGARNYLQNPGYDIYEFKMPEKAKPDKVMIVKGTVKTDEGNPPQDAVVKINYTESKQQDEFKVNSDDGSYAAIVKLDTKENVTLSVEGEKLAFNSRTIAKPNQPAPVVVTKLNMEAQELKANKPIVLNDIFYSTSKAEIEESSKILLDAFAAYLVQNSTIEIEILGHTDNVGDDKTNFALSKERAYEVMSYLISKGVAGKRISFNGYGETKPVADNNTEDGRAKNRRTEFVVKKM
jgi:outer membrane protein OmpA-like peptidoglycan-associated protein/tetratricopeptide (TPR) repeat protein